jgi:DNA-nicking Smr family endonuclease
MTRRPRQLDPEERELWERVVRSTRALRAPTRPGASDPAGFDPSAPAPPAAEKQMGPTPTATPIAPFRIGASAPGTPHPARDHETAPPLRMDRRRFLSMTRGRSTPEARLDLHGLTLAEAHDDLARFLMRCHAAERRLVLVITGKGSGRGRAGPYDPSPGVLRRHVPHWLALPPLDRIVLQTAEAHQRHGGAGALYVYLARRTG